MKFGLILATDYQEANLNSLAPIGLGCLEAIINQELPEIQVVFKENPEDLIQEAPDIVGISSTTEYYHLAVKWAASIKRRLSIPVIIGGVHISLLPESMTNDFDLAVIGEGDYTIIDVLSSFIENKCFAPDKLKDIPGLYFRHQGKPVHTQQRALIQDLDSLPPIKWQNLPYHKWWQAHIVASRGCPYKCSFCASEKFSRQYRFHSADTIIKEIEHFVVEKKLGSITYFDDLLIANKKRLTELVKKLEEKKLLGKCRFHCQVRANLVDDDTCKLLQQLNIATLGIGIETFSDKILKYYNKTGITAEINEKAIDTLSKYGFKVNPSIIFGAPIETREDMLLTLRAIFRNFQEGKLTSPAWTLLRPYPGTAIWDYAEKKGLVSTDMDWEKFANWGTYDLYLCEEVSKDEFEELILEWRTKISLQLYDKLDSYGGNFILPTKKEIFQNALKYREIITKRLAKKAPGELGDELILTSPMFADHQIIYLDGWYPEEKETNTRWIQKNAEAVLSDSNKKQLSLKGYIPPTVFRDVYAGSLELKCALDDTIFCSKQFTIEDSPDGNIHMQCELPPIKDQVILRLSADKNFVPQKIDPTNTDIRELSLVISELILV